MTKYTVEKARIESYYTNVRIIIIEAVNVIVITLTVMVINTIQWTIQGLRSSMHTKYSS